MDCSTPGSSVLHCFPKMAQSHVHCVSDAIISSSAALFFSLQSFQHQGLFQWVSSLHQVAIVLELQTQHQSFQWIFRLDFLYVHVCFTVRCSEVKYMCIYNYYILLDDWSLYHYIILFFASRKSFWLEPTLSAISIVTPVLFCSPFTWTTSVHPFTFLSLNSRLSWCSVSHPHSCCGSTWTKCACLGFVLTLVWQSADTMEAKA